MSGRRPISVSKELTTCHALDQKRALNAAIKAARAGSLLTESYKTLASIKVCR